MGKHDRFAKAIDRLASNVKNGELLARTDGAALLDAASEELEAARIGWAMRSKFLAELTRALGPGFTGGDSDISNHVAWLVEENRDLRRQLERSETGDEHIAVLAARFEELSDGYLDRATSAESQLEHLTKQRDEWRRRAEQAEPRIAEAEAKAERYANVNKILEQDLREERAARELADLRAERWREAASMSAQAHRLEPAEPVVWFASIGDGYEYFDTKAEAIDYVQGWLNQCRSDGEFPADTPWCHAGYLVTVARAVEEDGVDGVDYFVQED